MPGGRPTEYRSEHCDEIVRLAEEGYSLTACAGLIGVSRPTLFNWAGQHPEFLAALTRARGIRTAKFERDLLEAQTDTGGAWVHWRLAALRAAARDDWSERIEVAHDATGGLAELLRHVAERGGLIGHPQAKEGEE